MTYTTINPEKSNGGHMTDYVLYESSSVFFQVANALPPEDATAGLDNIPKMFRTKTVAERLAVAEYIQDPVAIGDLCEYINATFDRAAGENDRIDKQREGYLELLIQCNSPDALQSWYVEVYQDDDIVFFGRRPYPKHMDADAIQTWLHREFNAEEYTAMNPQPHPFLDGGMYTL
tara:strand:+ start:312 stop:836 length:525 start_codon:yes stop_codon:yes gene_type:complete